VRTYVINLARAVDRRRMIEREVLAAGLEYEFVEGVEGRALSQEQRAELVDRAEVARYPNWLTPGAVGCILSHRRVYERVADANAGPALVLEDDGRLQADLGTLSERLGTHVAPDEVLLLNVRSFEPLRLSEAGGVSIGGYRILRPVDLRQPVSTLAYIVGQQAAAQMRDAIVPVRWAADSWGEYVERGLIGSLRCVIPRPVSPDIRVMSTIRHGEQPSFRRSLVSAALYVPRQANRHWVSYRMNRVELVD
jgi:glycosyl transferase, family 25